MIIADKELAENVLSSTNYYRLSGYWLYYELSRNPHKFKLGTTFEQIIKMYNFDKELRSFLFDGISRFEVSLRTRWAYETGLKYGPQAFYYKKYSKNQKDLEDNIKVAQREVRRSKELFIRHSLTKYSGKLPAAWVTCEVMSFGNLSCWYSNLKEVISANPTSPGNAKDAIASFYNVDSKVLESWIHSLAVLRNLCAHQARVVCKKLSIMPVRPKSKKIAIKGLWTNNNTDIYNLILALIYLNNQITAPSGWVCDFKAFLKSHKDMCVKFLSFPAGWDSNQFWA